MDLSSQPPGKGIQPPRYKDVDAKMEPASRVMGSHWSPVSLLNLDIFSVSSSPAPPPT